MHLSLKVELDKIPEILLCGEVQSITLKFCNDGTIPLKNLKIASNTPSFLALGTDVDLVDSVPFSSIYPTQEEDICGEIPGSEPKEVAVNGIIVIDIPIPNGILKPNFTMTVPMWIRGNDVAGVHTMNFLFYYEPVEQDTKIK